MTNTKTWLTIAFLILLTSFSSNAFACKAILADPWYIITTQLEALTLPSNIVIETEKENGTVGIINPTAEPFYINTEKSFYEKSFGSNVEGTSDPYLYKLIDNKVYIYSASYKDNEIVGYNWREQAYTKGKLIIYPYSLKELGYDVVYNVNKDDRPLDLKAPSKTDFKLAYFYKNQTGELKGSVLYELNPTYNPKAEYNKLQEERKEVIKETAKQYSFCVLFKYNCPSIRPFLNKSFYY